MSKKNLARTAIEGGRIGSNKFERRESTQIERVNTRLAFATVHNDVELLQDVVLPERRPVYKEFSDKLNPVYRWLDSHVGESWDEIHSLLISKFDDRTTSGRHILYDHILREVCVDNFQRYQTYYVDDKGFLQKKERRAKQRWPRPNAWTDPVSIKKKQTILTWMGINKIGIVGDNLYWYVPTSSKITIVVAWNGEGILLYQRERKDYKIIVNEKGIRVNDYSVPPTIKLTPVGVPSYRQDKKFSAKDLDFFYTLPEWMRNNLVSDPLDLKDQKNKYW